VSDKTEPSAGVCVLGSSGFVGAALLRHLQDIDVRVRGLSRKPATCDDSVEYRQGDLLDATLDLELLLDGCSVLFNCVGELADESLMEALHVSATRRLLDACKARYQQAGAPLHWVQLSSVGAYGPPAGSASMVRQVTEVHPLAPRGIYEYTKALADQLILDATQEGYITSSILRPSNIFGRKMPSHSLRQLINFIRSGKFFYIGFEKAIAPYVHVDDVARALVLCACDSRARNQIFNISADVLQRSLVVAIAEHFQVRHPWLKVPVWIVRALCWGGGWVKGFPLTQARVSALVSQTRYPADKLRLHLGFVPSKSIIDTFTDVLD
jgi:nucleoside-diphosphate-sugar epimerase